MNLTRILVVIFIFFQFGSVSFSQTKGGSIPLKQAIKNIEKQFPVLFSYQDHQLENHMITLAQETSLESYLIVLNTTTLFNFSAIDKNTITVTQKDNLKSSCGLVYGEDTKPLQNVRITTKYQQFYSDDEGRYKVVFLEKSIQVTASYQGFEDAKFSLSQSDICTNNTTLVPEITNLETVQLQNYLAKGISKNTDGSITVDYTNFDLLPGLIEADVLQTLQALPGIQSVNETVSDLNIRGGTNDQNLILWDGIKMYQSGHFFGLISAFNPFLTEKVTVTKNGTSARYGDGVSGVINMRGKATLPSEIGAQVSLNLLSVDATITLPISKKIGLQISGRKSINGLVRSPTFNQYFDKAFQNTEVLSDSETTNTTDDDFSFFDANMRILYEPSTKDKIRANLLIIGNDLSFLENATIDNLELSRRSSLLQNNLSAGLWYQRNWSEQWQTEVQLYGSSYGLEATNFDILNDQRLIQENEILETGLKMQSKHLFGKQFQVLFGYQFNETGITNFEDINRPPFQRTDTQVLRTNSLFSEISYTNTPVKLDITVGARFNHFSKFEEVRLEPRMSIKKGFLDYFTAEVLGEIKSQTTSQIIDFQEDFLGVENRRWVVSNPDEIPIIKSKQISTGVTYNRKGWLINLDGYIKEVSGITSQSQGFQNQFQEVKTTGKYTIKGIEVLVNKRYQKINTWLSYTYAKNVYTFDALIPSEFHNNLDIRHTITYGINYVVNRFKFSGGFNWHSGKPTTLVVQGNEVTNDTINYQAPNSDTIEDYFRVDLSATYDFTVYNNVKGQIAASIWNLLNTNNSLNHFYRLNHSNTLEEVSENSLRFTPNIALRFFF